MGDHIRILAPYDLHQLVYAFAVILAVAAIFAGFLMARGQATIHRRLTMSRRNGALGGVLVVLGAILITLVGMATLGPWREPSPGLFPVHVADLQQSISEAERDAPKGP